MGSPATTNQCSTASGTDQDSDERGRLLAILSHDMCQPVQALKLMATALTSHPHSPAVQEIVNHVVKIADILSGIAPSIREMAALEPGRACPVTVPVGSVLNRVWSETIPVSPQVGVEVSMVEPLELMVHTDPNMLAYILRNLVNNALRYTPPGGRVLIGCRRRSQQVAIQVWDTGIGIESHDHTNIFIQGFRSEAARRSGVMGFGIGLATVRQLAARLGHEIHVKSAVGKGSLFEVLVPMVVAPVSS